MAHGVFLTAFSSDFFCCKMICLQWKHQCCSRPPCRRPIRPDLERVRREREGPAAAVAGPVGVPDPRAAGGPVPGPRGPRRPQRTQHPLGPNGGGRGPSPDPSRAIRVIPSCERWIGSGQTLSVIWVSSLRPKRSLFRYCQLVFPVIIYPDVQRPLFTAGAPPLPPSCVVPEPRHCHQHTDRCEGPFE